MKSLSHHEKLVLSKICKLELRSLESVFVNDVKDDETQALLKNEEFKKDFIDNLLDSYNYFKRLEVDPSLFFEIEEYDGAILYKVLKLLSNYRSVSQDILSASKSLIRRLEKMGYEEEIPQKVFSEKILVDGENKKVEYKSSLLYSFKKLKGSIDVSYKVAKAICAFMNSEGGQVIIGIKDNSEIQGIDFDYGLFEGDAFKKRDHFKLAFDNLVSHFFDYSVWTLIHTAIEEVNGKDICIISVDFSPNGPVFLRNRIMNNETKKYDIIKKEFYFRGEASTLPLTDIEELVNYVLNKWPQK